MSGFSLNLTEKMLEQARKTYDARKATAKPVRKIEVTYGHDAKPDMKAAREMGKLSERQD